jgi:hypothetical protein
LQSNLSRWFCARNHVTSAREQIVRILQSLTDISAAELGRRVGVSRERVRQILRDLNYPTARGKGRAFGRGVLARVDIAKSRRISKAAALKMVAEDLLERGFAVLAPLRATNTCDLVAVDSQCNVTLIRVQVDRTGKRAKSPSIRGGTLHHRTASVSANQPVVYEPSFPTATRRSPRR